MKRFINHPIVTLTLLVGFIGQFAIPTYAAPAIKLHNWEGTIDSAPNGDASFTLEGTASQLGHFTAYGEVQLVADEDALEADGVVVFTAANGDQLVGITTWDGAVDSLAQLHFSWRDSITLSDGTIVSSTGRFLHDRPPGLVVIAIIAILMGLLLPAVQKVREMR